MKAAKKLRDIDYSTVPLEDLTIAELTDALGVPESAALLDTSARAIYTIRNTNVLSAARVMKLIDAVRAKEKDCRYKLGIMKKMHDARQATRAEKHPA
jgi:hypothetical protein